MESRKFDPQKLERLNDPQRLTEIPPSFLREKVTVPDPRIILDIGAGTGFFSVQFSEFTADGVVYACDVSETMVEWMMANIHPRHPRILPLKMEEYTVPLDDATADLIFMLNVYHEFDSPEKMMREAFRLMKAEAQLFIVDWKPGQTKPRDALPNQTSHHAHHDAGPHAVSSPHATGDFVTTPEADSTKVPGPPLHLRRHPGDIEALLLQIGFQPIVSHHELLNHYLIVAHKHPRQAQAG